jgi:hypothetical protein
MNYERLLLRYKKDLKAQQTRSNKLFDESIQKIRSRQTTREIKYPEYQDAFDFVDARYPEASVKDAVVLECSRIFMDKIGYKGIGGFFSRVHKIVVIPDVMFPKKGKIKSIWDTASKDFDARINEILVHELFHYASNKTCEDWKSMQVEEEFAYGNSADYLRQQGRTDDDIIRRNFMPYLLRVICEKHKVAIVDPSRTKEEDKALFDKVYKEAYQLGIDILTIWDAKNRQDKPEAIKVVPFKQSGIDLDLD